MKRPGLSAATEAAAAATVAVARTEVQPVVTDSPPRVVSCWLFCLPCGFCIEQYILHQYKLESLPFKLSWVSNIDFFFLVCFFKLLQVNSNLYYSIYTRYLRLTDANIFQWLSLITFLVPSPRADRTCPRLKTTLALSPRYRWEHKPDFSVRF